MELGRHDEASSSSVGLAIAAATVAATFIVANLMVGPPSNIDSRSTALGLEAATALQVIVREGGLTSNGKSWGVDPDNLTRFGLTVEGSPNFLDYVKIKALRNGTLSSSGTNQAPDYPEVRASMGIVDSDLHLRSYPVMPGLDDPRWVQDRFGRVAYFAHYSGATSPVSIAQSYTKTTEFLNASIELENKGTTDAVYVVAFSLGDKDTGAVYVTEERHTVLLRAGDETTVWARFHKLPDWEPKIDAVKVEVTDPYGNIAVGQTGVEIGSFWYAEAPPSGGSNGAYNILGHSASQYYVSGDAVKFIVDHYDGGSDHVNNAQGRFVLIGPNGKEWVNQSISLPKQPNAVYTYVCPNCTTVGNYTMHAYSSTLSQRHTDYAHVSAAQMFTEKKNIDPIASAEIGIIQELVRNFNPTRYHETTNPTGDIFGDDSNGPNEIASVLSRYTTLIIGSEVSQTSLNSAVTKYAIADWVQAQGNLVVLGTHAQQSRWLEPIYQATQETANGGISAPDPTHPVLTSPNKLSYDRYLDRARAWQIKNPSEFTHVLTRGAVANDYMEDTLAVSAPGALGNGTVVLTSYMPGSLTSPQDDLEGKRLLHNLMSQGYTMLFLDYGPPIPEGSPVGSASRLAAVPHPNVPGAVVEVRLILYLFG